MIQGAQAQHQVNGTPRPQQCCRHTHAKTTHKANRNCKTVNEFTLFTHHNILYTMKGDVMAHQQAAPGARVLGELVVVLLDGRRRRRQRRRRQERECCDVGNVEQHVEAQQRQDCNPPAALYTTVCFATGVNNTTADKGVMSSMVGAALQGLQKRCHSGRRLAERLQRYKVPSMFAGCSCAPPLVANVERVGLEEERADAVARHEPRRHVAWVLVRFAAELVVREARDGILHNKSNPLLL